MLYEFIINKTSISGLALTNFCIQNAGLLAKHHSSASTTHLFCYLVHELSCLKRKQKLVQEESKAKT